MAHPGYAYAMQFLIIYAMSVRNLQMYSFRLCYINQKRDIESAYSVPW